jgi:hypothetical protein
MEADAATFSGAGHGTDKAWLPPESGGLKVTLIAEAEAAKAEQELRKSIALRYAEIEFERLVELEQIITPLTFKVLTYAKCDPGSKTNEQLARVLEKSDELSRAVERAGIFITLQDERKFLEHRKLLQGVISLDIGPNQPILTDNDQEIDNLLKSNIALNNIVRKRIKQLGKL